METQARGTACESDPLAASSPPGAPRWWHERIRLKTGRDTEFVDITDRLQAFVTTTGLRVGLVNIQTLHTTTAIVINEHEPLLLADFASTLENAAPAGPPYRHDDANVRTVNVTRGERVNGHSHCRALLLGASACLNVVHGELQLGRWQRVFLAELDGPRERVLSVVVFGDAGQGSRTKTTRTAELAEIAEKRVRAGSIQIRTRRSRRRL